MIRRFTIRTALSLVILAFSAVCVGALANPLEASIGCVGAIVGMVMLVVDQMKLDL